MKANYSAPKLVSYGDVDALTQYIGPNPADDSFVIGGLPVTADGSTGPLNK